MAFFVLQLDFSMVKLSWRIFMSQLFKSVDDFRESVDKGAELCLRQPLESPQNSNSDDMKSLLAVFITATVKMDPESFNSEKLTLVRQVLLAAYNLGRNSRIEKG